MEYQNQKIIAGEKIPKGSVINLIVGDGSSTKAIVMGSLLNQTYERALFQIQGWYLNLGEVFIPIDVDTTGITSYVYKQFPIPGDSVSTSTPVNIWIAPKGYQPSDL